MLINTLTNAVTLIKQIPYQKKIHFKFNRDLCCCAA